MCGIAGILRLNRQPATYLPNLLAMSKAMQRRGPDDAGFFLTDNLSAGSYYFNSDTAKESREFHRTKFKGNISDCLADSGILFFTHRRLGIIDLSPGAFQPMTDGKQQQCLIFNGEIYNYQALREELKSLGHTFQTASDTEVLLKSYQQWQEKSLYKFNGDFALALYDSERQQLFLARDRLGVKPLFYTDTGHDFIFASDIKTLLASGLVKAQADLQGLWNNLTLTLPPGRLTSFSNIYSLEPGTSITIDLRSGRLTENQYWDIPHGQEPLKLPEDQLLELLEEKIVQAVRYRLVADVEVGSFMSGGIDSTTVTGMAAKINPGMKALTLGFYDNQEDETAAASMNAQKFGVQHIISRPSQQDYIDAVEDILSCNEEPYQALSPAYFMSKLAHQENLKVVISGAGGDELFAGYNYYPLWQQLDKYRPWKSIINLLPAYPHKVQTLKKLVSQNMHAYYRGMHGAFHDLEAADIFQEYHTSGEHFFKELYPVNTDFNDYGEQLTYLDLKWYVGRHQLYRLDQFSMHFSVEGRYPLLDHELLATAMRIPVSFKNKNGITKYPLRQIAAKYIAPPSLTMKKFGFSSPMDHLINNGLKERALELLTALKKRDFINPSGVDHLLLNYSKNATKLWQLAQVEHWLRYFIDKTY